LGKVSQSGYNHLVKHAVSISLGSSKRDKQVAIRFAETPVLIERIGTDGDIQQFQAIFRELDGKVDAFGIGGVDLFIRLSGKEYPLRAALALVKDVHKTPIVDGRGLKHTLERRIFELSSSQMVGAAAYQQAFIPMALDRVGLAEACSEVSKRVLFGDLMIGLGIPIPIWGIRNYLRVAKALMPIVSRFPISMLFYGSGGTEQNPRYQKYWQKSDLLAGDFMFMRKYLCGDLLGKTIITNTTTEEDLAFMQSGGVKTVITTTPRYEGRSFGTNMLEAALTAYAGRDRELSDEELNFLIEKLSLKPSVTVF
jgi:hypothetical protein